MFLTIFYCDGILRMLQAGVTSGGRQRRWAAAAVLSGSEDAAAVRPGWQRGAGATTDLDGS
jgi:hypothetical protein